MELELPEVVEELTCSECGSTNLYKETFIHKYWKNDREVDDSYNRYTCLNEECGEYWEVPLGK